MKPTWIKCTVFAFIMALLVPSSLLAQKDKDEKGDKSDKVVKEKNDVQQIIITRKGEKTEKVVVEINGDKITINGKPLDEYKDKDGDINVRLQKFRDLEGLSILRTPKSGTWNFGDDNNIRYSNEDANRAMLGVTTEKTEEGVVVQDITKESAAEKAGLKEKDIITKINDKKIEDPDDLSEAIQKHKPGEKVTITYLRDKKEQKVTAELTKWKGVKMFSTAPGQHFNFDLGGDMNFDHIMPKIPSIPRVMEPFGGQGWNWSGGNPKLGISVQDTDDGKGVKVIEVDEESNAAKAGVKEEDVITEVDGKAVNGADAIAKIIRESKDKASIMLKLLRSGKTQNIEVKMPRKLKTADL
jgi:serine protease Do